MFQIGFYTFLICWPPYDFPIIPLCLIPLEQIKINKSGIKVIRIEIVILYNHVFNDRRYIICINPRWPPCDLPIIMLYIMTLEQIKIETCIMCQNNKVDIIRLCMYMVVIMMVFCIN